MPDNDALLPAVEQQLDKLPPPVIYFNIIFLLFVQKDEDSDDDLSSTSTEDEGPPPMIQIAEKSADIGALDEDSDDDLSSTSTEDEGPPPMIQIAEKSADIGALKSTFLLTDGRNEAKQPPEKQIPVEGLGKENLVNITLTFENFKDTKAIEKAERTPLTLVDKERYSQYKQKFENIEEELKEKKREKQILKEDIKGAGKDTLNQTKDLFERLKDAPSQDAAAVEKNVEKKLDITLSADDKKRIKETFFESKEKDEPHECSICGQVVYPMEKLQLEKKVFHKSCFKCWKCKKTLNVQNYNSHEGRLYCKIHMMQLFHPEAAITDAAADDEQQDVSATDSDEESDYAIVRRPKALDPSVVKSSLKTADDLGAIPSLSNRRSMLEQSQEGRVERKSQIDVDLTQAGKVKDKLSRFVDGQDVEVIVLEVGAKEIKSKWESAAMEKAQLPSLASEELDALKNSSVKVKERFKERTAADIEERERQSQVEADLDTTFSREAREQFLKGFQDTAVSKQPIDDIKFAELENVKKKFENVETKPVERTELVDAKCAEMGNIKAAFEQNAVQQDEQDRQMLKQMQIESEFKRFKKEKRRLEEKERRMSDERAQAEVKTVPYEDPTDVRQCAELSSIKQRFEQGTAFQADQDTAPKVRPDLDLEIKVASKAREKFKKLDEEAPAVVQQPTAVGVVKESKWTKETAPVPEPINRRKPADDADEADSNQPEDFEVKHLLDKFKQIGQTAQADAQKPKGPKPKRVITPPPEGYKAEVESVGKERPAGVVVSDTGKQEEQPLVKTDAKQLREKFERNTAAAGHVDEEAAEEKRRELEEEFRRIKAEKEMAKNQITEDQDDADGDGNAAENKEDLAIAAEHAHKMRARWEKIQKKEAKKAQKSTMPRKNVKKIFPTDHNSTASVRSCPVCSKTVYLAEKIECDGLSYHKPCFRCKYCHINLRLETFVNGPDEIMSTDGRVEWSQTMATDSFSQGCHTARAVVGYAATLSTLVYVFLFCKYANLRTKLNWAVCNLITSNGLLALAMAIFSTLKAVDEHFLHDYCGCIVFTWVLVFLSFAPSWSVALMASTRAIHYSNFPSLDERRRISLPILVAVRLFTASADAIVTSVIVSQKESIALATRCTYQLMLDTSPVYMIYTLVIILALVTAGLWAIISRIRCRRKLLASLSANGAVGHDSSPSALLKADIPSNLFAQPGLVTLGLALAALFTLPRVAFFVDDKYFWQISTVCPVLIALLLPAIFIYHTDEFRSRLAELLFPNSHHNSNNISNNQHLPVASR
ncbi:LIM domain and actin-binding protein 1 [Trichinella spiralis]|uniref:LIM domain and actin-binding protein 1 n=1 Tax=Trichinella spiralis TaxID=6334 RepID=A0A0V1BKV5_TRISP|nr:LIM domain and actin-binding protein 1 [Trichinella spiralis]